MKKILLILSLLLFTINTSFACKIAELWKEIPKDFKQNCYELVWELSPKVSWIDLWNWNTCVWYQTFKINSTNKIDTFISKNKIIPHKLFKKAWEKINFKLKNIDWNSEYINDNNYKTFLIYDEEKNTNPIILEFDELINAWSFDFNFQYDAKYRNSQIEISKDWKKYYQIVNKDLKDYDFKFIKISFYTTVKHITPPEKIKISELSFISKNYVYLIKTRWILKAYSNNICKNNYINLSNNSWKYNLDNNTKSLNLKLEKNNVLNPNLKEDRDKDKITDSEDNCPNVYNPKQVDTNWNQIWDKCEDIDSDWIIWDMDNCPTIYNPNQKDINRNQVWDKCEFDKDSDWIFDKLDNCINAKNSDQKDSDNDWIWDTCDNCKLYNPRQIDKNNNNIWDVCEEHDKYILEHDKDWDKIIDSQDNCKNIANPNQEDSDKDLVWDVCDNCINIQNTNQLDKNKNWKWDMCEDSDWDWIDWLTDNCINIANPNQRDSDNDGIWDLCEDDDNDNILAKYDNCPFDYNPLQSDMDSDWIWDVCDKNDDRFIESNRNLFLSLIAIIIIIFGFAIWKMVNKLK